MAENKVSKIQKVLLINPFVYNSKNINIGIDPVVLRHAGQAIKTGVTFPIGLAYMAAMLLESGYEVKLLDPLAERLPLEKIYDASCWADAIVMPYSPGHKEGIKRYLSEFRHKVRIVVGGIAPHIHDYLLRNDLADIIIKGEPEETIGDLVRQYPNVSDVKGIIFRSDSNEPVINPPRGVVADLDRLPFPVRHLTNPAHYWDISFFGQPTAWILPSRGCSFDCIFCSQFEINQRGVRRRSPKNIVDEMEQVVKEQEVRNFVFFDETFNLSEEFVIGVCDEIIKRNLKVRWWCSARPDLVRPDVVKRMKESGCIEMRFGIESANDEILRYLNKDTTVEKMKRGIQITKEAGMNFSLQCIFGSPQESESTIKNTMDFVRKMNPLYVSFNVLTPLPGSRLFGQLKDKLNLEDGLKNFDILHTDYPLGRFSSQELSQIIKDAYRRYYLSPQFARRILVEFWKNPATMFFLLRCLFKQAGYIYSSIFKAQNRSECKN
ncbi:MAG: radical SAM protein [Candidatus Omnitrophota bacterium]